MGWLSGWKNRVKIVVDHGDVDSTLTWFPVLVHLSGSCGVGSQDLTHIFDELAAAYLKIAVTQSDGQSQLFVEVEEWDSSGEEAWLWVSRSGWQISSAKDTSLYLYYDKSHANNTVYVGLPNSTVAEKVWDSNFKLVCHMRDDPDTSHVRDSTSNDNDGTKKGANEPQVTTSGKISDAQQFDGDDYIDLATNPSVRGLTKLTVELWLKMVASGTYQVIYHEAPNVGTANTRATLFLDSSEKLHWYGRDLDGNPQGDWVVSDAALTPGTWYHICAIFNSVTDTHYLTINNVSKSNNVVLAAFSDTAPATTPKIGIRSDLTLPLLNGSIVEEFRLSFNEARSSAWVKASYETQCDHLLTYGVVETEEAATYAKKPKPQATTLADLTKKCQNDFGMDYIYDPRLGACRMTDVAYALKKAKAQQEHRNRLIESGQLTVVEAKLYEPKPEIVEPQTLPVTVTEPTQPQRTVQVNTYMKSHATTHWSTSHWSSAGWSTRKRMREFRKKLRGHA